MSSQTPFIPAEALLEMRLASVRAADKAGDFGAVVVEAEELLDTHPDHLEALSYVGAGSLKIGDGLAAEAAFARYLELSPGDSEALLGLGLAHFELTDFGSAVLCFQRVLEAVPENADAWYHLGLASLFLQEKEAEQQIARAEELDPERFPSMPQLTAEELNEIIEAAVEGVQAEEMREWISKLPFIVLPLPPTESLRTSVPPLSPHSVALFVHDEVDNPLEPFQGPPKAVEIYSTNLRRAATAGLVMEEVLAGALEREAMLWMPEDGEAA